MKLKVAVVSIETARATVTLKQPFGRVCFSGGYLFCVGLNEHRHHHFLAPLLRHTHVWLHALDIDRFGGRIQSLP